MLVAANFHYIRERFDAPYPSIFGVTPGEFGAQLDALGATAVFLGLDDVIAIIDGRRQMPRRAVVVTFDDGFREQYELAWPILRSRGIPAVFFVNTKPIAETFVTTTHKIHVMRAHTAPREVLTALQGVLATQGIRLELPNPGVATNVYKYDRPEDAQIKYFLNHQLDETQRAVVADRCFEQLGYDEGAIGRTLYMTPEMVRDLSDARVLGTHGHAHLPLGLLDEDNAIGDVRRSLELLRSWCGRDVPALSYPFGFREACSPAAADHASRHGVRFAFTMERAGNATLDQPFFMGRYASNDVPGGSACKDPDAFWSAVRHATWFRDPTPAAR